MKTNRPISLLIGIVTLWPLVYFVLFLASGFLDVSSGTAQDAMPIFGTFKTMMTLHLATMGLMLLLMIFYIVHAFKNLALTSDKRLHWVIVLFFGSFVAGIIHWFHYVWRHPQELSGEPGSVA